MSGEAPIIETRIVIAIVNGKGGAGKTPTAVALAYSLAGMGYKVLFCDMDQQASASFHFLGFKFRRQDPTIYHVLKDLTHIDPIEISSHLHLLSATADLQFLEVDLTGQKGLFWQGRLDEALQLYPDYQIVVCDTPGSAVSIFPTMVLTSASIAVVPTKTEVVAVVGTGDTLNLVEDVQGPDQRRPLNRDLKLWGILPNQYEARVGSHNDALNLLQELYGKKGTPIYREPSHKTTLYNEASERHSDIRDTDPTRGPALGAYWDTIAQDVLRVATTKVSAS